LFWRHDAKPIRFESGRQDQDRTTISSRTWINPSTNRSNLGPSNTLSAQNAGMTNTSLDIAQA
jgi:hypothetical protein